MVDYRWKAIAQGRLVADIYSILIGKKLKTKEIVAHARVGKSKPMPLSSGELSQCSPCEVVKNALPTSLANKLLEVMVEDTKQWIRGTWWMFGKEHIAPRSSAFFEFGDTGQVRSFEHLHI